MSPTPIPHLAPGQPVKEWRRRYLAATATLNDDQKKQMIPAYVHRSDGEVLLAEAAITETTLTGALSELEELIDGTPGRVTSVNEFWALKPASQSYTDLVSYFFLLKSEAELAKVTPDMLLIKFLNAVPEGSKVYDDNAAEIKPDMKEDKVKAIFRIVKDKLTVIKKKSTSTYESIPQIKKEREDFDVFVADEGIPRWAEELRDGLHNVQGMLGMYQGDEDQDSPDEERMQSVMYNKPNSQGNGAYVNDSKCWICLESGHYANRCRRRKCVRCGNEGHHEKKCFVKLTENNRIGNSAFKPKKNGL